MAITRQDIHEYSKLIFSEDSLIVNKSEELLKKLHNIAESIHKEPAKSHGRTFEQIYEDNKNIVIEDALVQKNNGFIHNPLEWDYKNPHSHAYDIIFEPKDVNFELKRWQHDTRKEAKMNEWFSYPEHAIQNFYKHIGIIDYLVSARMIEHEDCFEIGFHLIAHAKSFSKFAQKSIHDPRNIYYNHHSAEPLDLCVFNKDVKYRS